MARGKAQNRKNRIKRSRHRDEIAEIKKVRKPSEWKYNTMSHSDLMKMEEFKVVE